MMWIDILREAKPAADNVVVDSMDNPKVLKDADTARGCNLRTVRNEIVCHPASHLRDGHESIRNYELLDTGFISIAS